MKYITKIKLASVKAICDAENKSPEYMLQLMQDTCKVSLDTCLKFLDLFDLKIIENEFLDLVNVLEKLGNT